VIFFFLTRTMVILGLIGTSYDFWVFLFCFVLGAFPSIWHLRRFERAVVIVSDHWVEHWIGGKKRLTLVLGPDVHINVDLRKVQVNPVTREFRAIKIYKRGLGKIHLRRDDGWTEEHLKELWWALYALDKRYLFQFDYEVELIKKAATMMSGSQAEMYFVRDDM
jgi:hypothetical protein